MNATVTPIVQPSDIELAWAEREYRKGVARRYDEAVLAQDWAGAAFVWLEATAYDKANQDSSPLADELGLGDLPAAA